MDKEIGEIFGEEQKGVFFSHMVEGLQYVGLFISPDLRPQPHELCDLPGSDGQELKITFSQFVASFLRGSAAPFWLRASHR